MNLPVRFFRLPVILFLLTALLPVTGVRASASVPAACGALSQRIPTLKGELRFETPDDWRPFDPDHPHYLAQFRRQDDAGLVRFSLVTDPVDGFTLGQLERGFGVAQWLAREVAVSGSVVGRKLPGPGNRGYCLTYRLRSPDKLGFENVAQGSVLIKDVSFAFEAAYNGGADGFVDSIVRLVQAARLLPEIRLQLSTRPWYLAVDTKSMKIERDTTPVRLMAGGGGLALSVFLEDEGGERTSQECREAYVRKLSLSPVPQEEPASSEHGAFAVFSYRVTKFNGRRIDQKHLHAYLAHDGTCIEVHVSKVRFRPSDEGLLEGQLSRVRVVDASAD